MFAPLPALASQTTPPNIGVTGKNSGEAYSVSFELSFLAKARVLTNFLPRIFKASKPASGIKAELPADWLSKVQ